MAVGIVATLKIQDGKQSAFEEAFAACQKAVKATEPGCALYTLCRDKSDDTTYVVMEIYTDEEARKKHGSSDEVRAAMSALGGLLAGAPSLAEVEIVSSI